MSKAQNPLRVAFTEHSRRWGDFLYAYPVISRRSRGLSIGINLNPNKVCNFDCVYCQVDRTTPPRVNDVDLAVLETELRDLLSHQSEIFNQEQYRDVPPAFRVLRDIAFSGDGEPTSSPLFPEAAQLAARLRSEFGFTDARIVVLTNACYLTRPRVSEALAYLDEHGLDIWAKLDAGTEAMFREIAQTEFSLEHVLENILAAARIRPIVLQSLFMRINGEPPSGDEIAAYVDRVRRLLESGGQIRLIQAYTIARKTAQPHVTALSEKELRSVTKAIGTLGITVESFR